jgi:hypothetical protein
MGASLISFLSLRELQREKPHELEKLIVFPAQLRDFHDRGTALDLRANPRVDGLRRDAVVFGCLRDRDAVVFDAINNLLFSSGAMRWVFIYTVRLTNNGSLENGSKIWGTYQLAPFIRRYEFGKRAEILGRANRTTKKTFL